MRFDKMYSYSPALPHCCLHSCQELKHCELFGGNVLTLVICDYFSLYLYIFYFYLITLHDFISSCRICMDHCWRSLAKNYTAAVLNITIKT